MITNLVIETMGTVATISLGRPSPPALRAGIIEILDDIETRFSLYRESSEASRVNRHELLLRETSPDYRTCFELALDWQDRTDGAFTPYRPDGVVDMAGVVKAVAIQRVGDELARQGLDSWCINIGGDVLVEGARDDGPWLAGIVDPADRTQYLTQFSLSQHFPALATSGLSERGEHIWRLAANDTFTQVSVAASDIITADVLATAILAGGRGTLDAMTTRFNLAVIALTRAGEILATDHFLAESAHE